ncbi:butyrate kinase [Sporomusa malonica]|nr:butyrate kinase [Sporomusa malonica]
MIERVSAKVSEKGNMAMAYTILTINPGSTSTKIGVYNDAVEFWSEKIIHDTGELSRFASVNAQYQHRLDKIKEKLRHSGVGLSEFDAFVARGGLLKPVMGGTYAINEGMLADLRESRYGTHASNLGALLAQSLAMEMHKPAFIVDPVVVDELKPVARITGRPEIKKRSIFHALNQKAIAHRLANQVNRPYEELTLIVAHLGGGISVGCHNKGRVIEVNNSLDGEGPFSPERAGTVQAAQFAELLFTLNLDRERVTKLLAGQGGLVAHLGTNDVREVENRITAGDDEVKLIYDAMIYQIARFIAAAAVPVSGCVDYIAITGGMAHSEYIIKELTEYISFIAPVKIFPGEDELKALAEGALRVLRGDEECREYI